MTKEAYESYKCKNCGRTYTNRCKEWWEYDFDIKTFCSEWCEKEHKQTPEIIRAMENLLSKLDDDGVEDLLKIMFVNTADEYGDYDEDEPFDKSILEDVIEKRFGGKEGIRTWGLW